MDYLRIARRALAVEPRRPRETDLRPAAPVHEPRTKKLTGYAAPPLANDSATVIATQNQCGQCLTWCLSMLVELGGGQRIYLCPSCSAEHRRQLARGGLRNPNGPGPAA